MWVEARDPSRHNDSDQGALVDRTPRRLKRSPKSPLDLPLPGTASTDSQAWTGLPAIKTANSLSDASSTRDYAWGKASFPAADRRPRRPRAAARSRYRRRHPRGSGAARRACLTPRPASSPATSPLVKLVVRDAESDALEQIAHTRSRVRSEHDHLNRSPAVCRSEGVRLYTQNVYNLTCT